MTEPTWTPWLENSGTSDQPYPDWAEECEYWMTGEGDAEGRSKNAKITHYRYAIPADLAWLAENVSGWDSHYPDNFVVVRGKYGPRYMHPECFAIKIDGCVGYTKAQWLRTRQDLGYDNPSKNDAVQKVTKYKAVDGELFDSREDAEHHSRKVKAYINLLHDELSLVESVKFKNMEDFVEFVMKYADIINGSGSNDN